MGVVEEAYEAVSSSTGPSEEWHALWEQRAHLFKEKVTEQQRAVMDRDFTEDELLQALQELPGGESPGHDGMTT